MKQMKAGDEDRKKVMGMLERFHRDCEHDAKGTEHEEAEKQYAEEEGGEGGEEEEEGEEEEGAGHSVSSILSKATLDKILSRISRAQDKDLPSQDPLSPPTLESLLSSLDISDLTPDELQSLHRAATTGQLSHLIEPWVPWWQAPEAKELRLGAGGTAIITPLCGDGAEGITIASHYLPRPPSSPLPPISTLTSTQPSAMLRYHVLDILFSYCLVLRTFNGDVHSPDTVWEAAHLLLSLSSCLKAIRPSCPLPQSASDALISCLDRSCRPPVGDIKSRGMALVALSDVPALLLLRSDSNLRGSSGRSALILALYDASIIMQEAAELILLSADEEGSNAWVRGKGRGRSDAASRSKARKEIIAAGKKLMFLCSWVNEQDEISIVALGDEAEAVRSQSIPNAP